MSRTRKDFYSLIESSAYLKPMISYRVRWSCAGMFLRHLLAECLEHQELVAERGRERESSVNLCMHDRASRQAQAGGQRGVGNERGAVARAVQ